MKQVQNYIADNWVVPDHTLPAQLCDANTGEVLASQLGSSAEQLEQALTAAQENFAAGSWSDLHEIERASYLEAISDSLAQRADELARIDAVQTGVVINSTARVAMICAAAFKGAAKLLRELETPPALAGPHGDLLLQRLPLGVAAIIAPWNAPSGIACHKLASSLAAGCPSIFKSSEWSPGSAQIIAECIAGVGLPMGTFQMLHGAGDTGGLLVADERVAAVSFTGGLQGGWAVAHACAESIKPAQLELGGNNPLLVLNDANIEAAAEGVVAALTTLNGQWCRALGRLLVHESILNELLAVVAEKMESVVIGSSLAEDSTMGSLVHEVHRQRVSEAIQQYVDEGGELHEYGVLPDLGGWFLRPTLVSGLKPTLTLEEIFGPVAAVHTFADDAEALALANQTPCGLAAYVFGEEAHAWQVARGIRAGNTKINGVSMLNLNPQAPRPAWGLSGLGDEGTRETFEFFRGHRLIGVAAKPGV